MQTRARNYLMTGSTFVNSFFAEARYLVGCVVPSAEHHHKRSLRFPQLHENVTPIMSKNEVERKKKSQEGGPSV